MPLDEKRQALLDSLCHCYGVLLDHLDAFDDAARQHSEEWTAHRVVKECFNKATRILVSESTAVAVPALCDTFLSAAEDLVKANLGRASEAAGAYAEYRRAVEATPATCQVDMTHWQLLGEELSAACYQIALPTTSSNLSRAVGAIRVEPSDRQGMRCMPRKHGGESEITFYFHPPDFVFQSYVNMPFYCFHEYLSHLHTAPLLAEATLCDQPFEDGWLLYAAHRFYERSLREDPHGSLGHPLHRLHYAERYVQDLNHDAIKKPWVVYGFEQARNSEWLVGSDLFWRTSLLVASSPHDHFPDIRRGVQWEYMHRVKHWLDKVVTKAPEQQGGLLAELDSLLRGPDPLEDLFEFLIRP